MNSGVLEAESVKFSPFSGELHLKFPVIIFATSPESTANLRMVVLAGLALFVALPLSLVRDLENLQYICASRYSLQASAHTHAYMSQ